MGKLLFMGLAAFLAVRYMGNLKKKGDQEIAAHPVRSLDSAQQTIDVPIVERKELGG